MRHQVSKVKINRKKSHLKSMLGNLAVSIILHEKVRTTRTKAKAVKPLIDRLIATAKKKDQLNSIRYLNKHLPEELACKKIMEELVTRYKDRPSGFTTIAKLEPRRGDAAPMVQIALVTNE